MKKKFVKTLILCTLFVLLLPTWIQGQNEGMPRQREVVNLLSQGPLKMSELSVNSDRVGLYEKFEITFGLTGNWDNPFDPEQIKVDATFTDPQGKNISVPGFFYQDYRLNEKNRPEKVGQPVWKVRFTPVLSGDYKYVVVANNKGTEEKSPVGNFTSINFNANHGFLGVSKTNQLYLEFIDGTSFFGIGQDRSQGEQRGCYQRFANSGGNFNRLFLTNGNFNIEELNTPAMGADLGIGKMNQECSWNLDKVLELGEKLGIYHMLTITNQWAFNQMWKVHAYNIANGGPLNSKNEYWTNEEAMKLFERRLRYHIARWGYSTAVFSWDLWNEYSAMGSPLDVAITWHTRMARYLRANDPFKHVIHTNDGSFNGRPEMHSLPEMEVVSTNMYGINDVSHLGESWIKRNISNYKKPYILTEFATWHTSGSAGGYAGMDPERRLLHDGLWTPIVTGGAATGMAWEGNWLDHEIFYTYLKAITKVVDKIPFSKRQWKPAEITSFTFAKSKAPYYADVIFEGWPGNYSRPRDVNPEVFNVDKSGRVEQQDAFNAVLQGATGARPGATSKVSLKVDFPVDGEFVTYVTEIRNPEGTPKLTITMDGDEVIKKDLTPLERPDYRAMKYDQAFPIKAKKGTHTFTISNPGTGEYVTAFGLNNYLLKNGPDLEVRGLQADDYMIVWFKNPKFTILHELMGIKYQTQPEGVLQLKNVADGQWKALWVNTVTSETVKSELIKCTGGKLVLNTPSIDRSYAVRLERIP